MDRRIIAATLSILLCASVAWGRMGLMVVGGGASAVNDPCVGTLVCESFEGTGTPSGWTVSGSTFNFDATTTAIDGAQYLTCDYNASSGYINIPFTESSTVYVAGKIRFRDFPSSTSSFMSIRSSSAELGDVQVYSDGRVKVAATGGSASAGSATFTDETVIYFKIKYVAGTGSNATITAYSSTDGINWTQKATSTNGTSTANPVLTRLILSASPMKFDVDSLRVDDADINY